MNRQASEWDYESEGLHRNRIKKQDEAFQAAMRASLGLPAKVQPKRVLGRPAKVVKPRPHVRDYILIQPTSKVPTELDMAELPTALPHWKKIARVVASKHGLTFEDLMSRRRDRKSVAARFEAYYRIRNETTMSLPQIGMRFGGKDHTTVMHGIRRHTAKLAVEGV